MITKLTAENNELYQARFELMNQAFLKRRLSRELTQEGFPQYLTSLTDEQAAQSNEILQISSLEEYFANIKTIQMFVTKDKNNEYVSYPEYTSRCLMMAVDEPLFEINANTRTITVPAEFKKNGIAVVGDHQAETVYFKIDKYFDYQSFYDLLQGDNKGKVVINWTFTPAGSKIASDVQSVYAFGPSDDLEPGYLIFGWIIDNDMTKGAGTLTFSVQFYHETNGDIDYSFNTLTATVAVGNTLNIKAPSEVKDNSTTLGLRLRNGAYRVDAIEGPVEPSWIYDLAAVANMPFNDVDDTQDTLVLAAEAGIKMGKTIQYRWFATVDGTNTPVEVAGTDVYDVTTDTSAVDNKLYYKAVAWDGNERPVGWQLLVGDAKTDAFNALAAYAALDAEAQAEAEVPMPVYERKSKIEVNKAGRYSAQANAKVDISTSSQAALYTDDPSALAQLDALTRSIDSTVCVVPAASDPVVELNITSSLNANDIHPVDAVDNDGNEYVYIANNAAPEISATVTGDNLGAFAVVMLDNDNNIIGAVPAVDFTELSDADILAGYTILDSNEQPQHCDYIFNRYSDAVAVPNNLSAQGNYKVGIINRLNNTYATGESANITTSFVAPIVTNITVKAADGIEGHEAIDVLVNGTKPGGNTTLVDLNVTNTLFFVDNTDYSAYDGCIKEYYLMEVVDDDSFELLDTEGDNPEVLLPNATFLPNDNGWYRIKVVTKYHNTTNTGYTDVFRCII